MDRRDDALGEPSAKPELPHTVQPSVFRSQDTRLKDWAVPLGVVYLGEQISCLELD